MSDSFTSRAATVISSRSGRPRGMEPDSPAGASGPEAAFADESSPSMAASPVAAAAAAPHASSAASGFAVAAVVAREPGAAAQLQHRRRNSFDGFGGLRAREASTAAAAGGTGREGFVNVAFDLRKSQSSLSLHGIEGYVATEDAGGRLKFKRNWGASYSADGPVIRLEQLAPSDHIIRDGLEGDRRPNEDEEETRRRRWPFKLNRFTSAKRSHHQEEYQKLSRRLRSYYKKQDELIEGYEQIAADRFAADEEEEASVLRKASILAKLSLMVNVMLLVAKGVAAGLSGSLSVISSLVDSAMDLVSGALFWYTNRKIKRVSPYRYPTGRTRLEPIAIIVLSVIMAVASFQLIVESIRDLISIVEAKGKSSINFDNPTLGVLAATMLSKALLFFACRSVDSPSTQALAQDHRNDVLSNAVAAICGFVAYHYWAYMDPIGAIVISLYIMVNWWRTGTEQVRMLTGHTAQPAFLNRITWLCLGHDPRIRLIDTVRAYHFGNDFLVEVHIVLPEDMSLKEAHDIGEPLQQKLERLPEVARAFVHIDYETEHDPTKEHKMPFGGGGGS